MKRKVPELRFPEFEDEWGKRRLGDIITIKSGVSPASYEFAESGKYPFLKVEELNNCEKYQSISRFYSNDSLNLIDVNSIVFPKRGAAILNNKVRINSRPVLMDSNLMAITPKASEVFHEFLFYVIIREELFKIADTSTIPQINNKHIEPYEVTIPRIVEQTKIASFLTAVDDKIRQLTRKKELLELYKKGVMQKIFSQEIRFRDEQGKGYPEWEKRKLDDVGKTYNGLTGKSKDDFGQGKPYIQYKQIFDDTRIDITRFDLVRIRDGEKQCRVSYGDVFFTTSSETPDEVGTSSVLLDEVSEVYLNSFCFGYRSSHDVLKPQFSRYLFRNALLRKEINKLAQGSTRYNISKNELMKTVVELPTIQEQTKIANFLAAIDDKISHTHKQLENMQTWKKGLLQKMFV